MSPREYAIMLGVIREDVARGSAEPQSDLAGRWMMSLKKPSQSPYFTTTGRGNVNMRIKGHT